MKKTLQILFLLFAGSSFAQADIQVVNTDNKTQFLLNSTNTYVVEVLNNGPDAATNVVVSDKLPSCTTSMSWSGSNGTSGTGDLLDTIASLPAGQKVTYTVVVQIPSNYNCPDPSNPSAVLVNLTNSVKVSSSTPDPYPACPNCSDIDAPGPDYVTVDINKFTTAQLVTDVLINTPCVNISNFLSTANCGFGYFNRNNSDFPIKEGVIIRCGNAVSSQGKFDNSVASTICSGIGDADLNAINCKNGNCGSIEDASSVKFNFVATGNKLSFRYLLASNEYGTYQCSYTDAFAFILTDLATGASHNLAVIPGTPTPIYDGMPVSVTNIRQKKYNGACLDANPSLFGSYNASPAAAVAASDINMVGQTVVLPASAIIIPGHQYSIKLVIGDYNDSAFDSAVFIEAGSFDFGQPSIVSGDGITDNLSLCDGSQNVLKCGTAKLPGISYSWKLNGVVIAGENDYLITINKSGTYTAIYTYTATGCSQSDDYKVVSANGVALQEPKDLYACQSVSNTFDLSKNVSVVLGNYKPDDFNINYFHSQADANNFTNPILNYNTYSGFNGETIFMTMEYFGSITNCIPVKAFKLHFGVPAPTGIAVQGFAAGATLNNLVVNGSGIKWYASETAGISLSNSTPLERGVIYYASQTIDGCESTDRLAVTSQTQLGMNEIAISNLSYSPNPVKNILNINSGEMIDSVSVINMLGQELYRGNYNNTTIQTDMSVFPAGTYFVKVQAGYKSSVFKIIKE